LNFEKAKYVPAEILELVQIKLKANQQLPRQYQLNQTNRSKQYKLTTQLAPTK